MSQKELTKKVELYLKRMRRNGLVQRHSLDKIAYWRVMGGAGERRLWFRGAYERCSPWKVY